MTAEPIPISRLQPLTPPPLERIVKRCLAKDPDDRWQTAHDLLIQLRWIAEQGLTAAAPAAAAATARKASWPVMAALGVGVLLAAAAAWPAYLYLRGPAPQEAFQVRVPVTGLSAADISISPDGTTIALVARPDTREPSSLFLRPVGAVTFRKVAGTDDATLPFWSPDSSSVGFVAGGRLKRVNAASGSPEDIGPAAGFTGGTWSASNTILFGSAAGLWRVSAEGGTPEPLTTVEKPETGHFWPCFLPDGSHYLYLSWSDDAKGRAIIVGSIGSKDKTKLVNAESNVAYAAPGYVLFAREATVFAQRFDAGSQALSGDPVQVAGSVEFNPANGRAHFDVSQTGRLIYNQGGGGAAGASGRAQASQGVQYGWVTRTNVFVAGAGEAGPYGDFDLSPDEKRIAVTRQEAGAAGADIWVVDWQRAGVATPLTLDPADDIGPVWAPNNTTVAFTSYRKGNADIYVKSIAGGEEIPLLASPAHEIVKAWSADGKYIAYLVEHDNVQDIYALPLSSDGKALPDAKPFPVVTGPFQKNEPQFSPDGRWLAYTAEAGGTFQIYVVAFPKGDRIVQISKDGGGQPRWSRDMKELFFKGLDRSTMAVNIKVGAGIEPGTPQRLFNARGPDRNGVPTLHRLAVSADSQRFLIDVNPGLVSLTAGGGLFRAPLAPRDFTPATLGSGAAAVSTNAQTTYGLTVVLGWPAAFAKDGK